VDYDADGRLDFLTGSIAGKVYLYRRKPNGTFGAPDVLKKDGGGLFKALRTPINVGRPSSVAMGDWFSSGKLDLFIGNGEGEVYLFPNDGTRQKPAYKRTVQLKAGGKSIKADGGMAGPYIADWDGDGKLDLLVGSGSGKVVWYRNTGSKGKPEMAEAVTLVEPFRSGERGTTTAAQIPKRSATNAKVCVADWNGDGRPDLIVGDYLTLQEGDSYRAHGWVWVYLRKPAGTGSAITANK